ncbi:anamorsin homolog [Microplitis mediator]|uniref:anamorsin homolog n=1 Tax=Microplitis mediator TaxID=375433 RepID=UPI0025549717|nr:anamorsin homolog [Microplitis mediator]
MFSFKSEDKILIIVDSDKIDDTNEFIEQINQVTNSSTQITVTHPLEILNSLNDYGNSVFDLILSFASNLNSYNGLLQVLKPGCSIFIHKLVNPLQKDEINKLCAHEITQLKLCGFRLNNTIQYDLPSKWKISKLLSHFNENLKICQVTAEKPSYEIGSSMALQSIKSPTAVWKLDNIDDDLIDEDDILNEQDKKKPNSNSLRVCGTTGKRKACKDCSCGLAEELGETTIGLKNEKSSCGNCYLGDAFRCGGCPYLGMPAFKSGEKILLQETQQNS